MPLSFTEDEQADFLLARGYMVCVRVEEYEENIYQNVFVPAYRIHVEAIKNNKAESLERAFEKEFKTYLNIY